MWSLLQSWPNLDYPQLHTYHTAYVLMLLHLRAYWSAQRGCLIRSTLHNHNHPSLHATSSIRCSEVLLEFNLKDTHPNADLNLSLPITSLLVLLLHRLPRLRCRGPFICHHHYLRSESDDRIFVLPLHQRQANQIEL